MNKLTFGAMILVLLLLPGLSDAQTTIIEKGKISVELLENTDICEYDSVLNLDYCRSLYRVCDSDGGLNPLYIDFKYRTQKDLTERSSISGLSTDFSVYSYDKNCKTVEITGYKNPYKNIDNIPCYNGVCFNEFVWWNSSFTIKYPINASTTSGTVTMAVLINDTAFTVNGLSQFARCNYTVNTTRRVVGWLYAMSTSTEYRCIDETETFEVEMDIDNGNETNIGNPYDSSTVYFSHMNNPGSLKDSSIYNVAVGSVDGTPTQVEGKISKGVGCDGSSDIVYTSTVITTITGDMTVMSWIKGSTGDGCILCRDNSAGTRAFAISEETNVIAGQVFKTNGAGSTVKGTAVINDGNWHHIAMTYDSIGDGSSILTTYVDGVVDDTISNAVSPIQTSTTPFEICSRTTAGRYRYTGNVDDVRIDNRTWTADEIQAEYNNTVFGDNFAPLGDALMLSENTSLLGADFDVADFSFSSTEFVPAGNISFNTSNSQTNFTLLSSMNIEKISGGGTNIITVRVTVDSNIILSEDLRTVTGTGTIGSTGTSPVQFNVSVGEHSILYEFKRTGAGSITIDNIDVNLLEMMSNAGFTVRSQVIPANYTFSSIGFSTAFNWTIPKPTNSSTFITVKQTVTKGTSGGSDLTFRFRNFLNNETSPAWLRFLNGASDIGSISGLYIDPSEFTTHEHTIDSRQTDVGDTVIVNGSLLDFDLKDSGNGSIPFFQSISPTINFTNTQIFTAGQHLLLNFTKTIENGDAYFLGSTVSFSSTSGAQTPRYFINSTTIPESVCFSEKERSLSNSDIGNVFFYTICKNISVFDVIEFELWLEVPSGETIEQIDQSFSGFEVTVFDTITANLAPIPNSITNPLNGSILTGPDIITWLEFTDPNGDLVNYTVIVNNLDGSLNTTIQASTLTLSAVVDWSSFQNANYFLVVTGGDPSGLTSNTTISIRVFNPPPTSPPSAIFCSSEDLLFTRTASVTTIDGISNITIKTETMQCLDGCSNFTIYNLGNAGCTENDFQFYIYFIIFGIAVVIAIRSAFR